MGWVRDQSVGHLVCSRWRLSFKKFYEVGGQWRVTECLDVSLHDTAQDSLPARCCTLFTLDELQGEESR